MIQAAVAKLVKASVLYTENREFKSHPPYLALVTQWIECRTSNPLVAGSIPA